MFAIAAEMLGSHAITRLLKSAQAIGFRRRIRRRRDLVRSGELERWLVSTASRQGLGEHLPLISHQDSVRRLAVYAPLAWAAGETPLPVSQVVPVRTESVQHFRQVDRRAPRAVRRREARLGQRIWDGDALITTELPAAYDASINATAIGYYDLADAMIGFEDEAFRCARSSWRRAQLRSNHGILGRRRGVGGTTVLVVFDGTEHQLLLHRRSDGVATNPGQWCVIPTFVFEDPAASGKTASRLDLTTWNAVRETMEEVFDAKELDRAERRPSADWFLYETELGRLISRLTDSGALRFIHLGWYVNLLNGLVDSITMAYFDLSKSEGVDLRSGVVGSASEVASEEGAIRWLSLHSDELSSMMLQPTFHSGSALAIDLSRKAVNVLRRPSKAGEPTVRL